MSTKCHECTIACEGNLAGRLKPELERFESLRRSFKMRKNQILHTVGQPLQGWYCLKQGRLRVYRVSRSGREQTYRIVNPGEWLGHREMIEGSDALFNSVSIQESELCFFPASLWSSIINNREFLLDLVNTLSNELRRSEEVVFALGTKKLHSRLAELLLNLTDSKSGEALSLTRELMSTMLGSTTESIVRALTDFKDRKWIEVEKNRIRLVNIPALQEMAQVDQI